MKTVCAVTVGRSDWGIYLPVLRAIKADANLKLHLVAAGAHLLGDHGRTLQDIESAGFQVDDQLEMLLASDSPVSIAKSMGMGTIGFADVYQRAQPDILLLLGDRFEMHAAAVAAIPMTIPIAHIHGGEVSHGAIDDALRHAISKYSHLHFASTEDHANRLIQLGEEPWRVVVSGAPALDNISSIQLISRHELADRLELDLDRKPLLVCYHPVTLQHQHAAEQTEELLTALSAYEGPIVISRPNADSGNKGIVELLQRFISYKSQAKLIDNLGVDTYFNLMNQASAMVGNSSSGIIEAASFQLPVVNIGLRQAGRAQSGNVLNVDCKSEAISGAIALALSGEFQSHVSQVSNIYGDGCAAKRIVQKLGDVSLDEKLIFKQFQDLPVRPLGICQAA